MTMIVVPDSPLAAQAKSALRGVIWAIGGAFVARGTFSTTEAAVWENCAFGIALAVWPLAWSWMRDHKVWAQQTIMELYAPDEIATTAGKLKETA